MNIDYGQILKNATARQEALELLELNLRELDAIHTHLTAAHVRLKDVCDAYRALDPHQTHRRQQRRLIMADLKTVVEHFRDFDAKSVHEQLGLGRAQWGAFSQALDAIAKIKLDSAKAKEVLDRVFKVPEDTITYIDPQVQKVLQLFQGKAIGADIAGQTGWGLVNAVTEYADHHKRARSQGNRLDNAWFGAAANIKDAVFHEVLELTS